MAWRIHDSVRRGEIDNRRRGVVRGRIWLDGYAEPVVLDLAGNACPDLAGCLLTFENTAETIPMRTDATMHPEQRGTIGDLTASRKVRVFDIPFEEAYDKLKKKIPVPEHMANCLYLEWFSEANGRVVIESTEYKLKVSAPEWTLSAEEEKQRQREAAEGFNGFLGKLSQALASQKHEPPEDKEWDEFDYEQFMREGDARTDKYMELLDKYMDHPDRDRIVEREMGWTRIEDELDEEETPEGPSPASKSDDDSGRDHPEGGGDADDKFDIDEINRACLEAAEDPLEPDPSTEGVDWVRDQHGDVKHPLSLRTFEASVALSRKCRELGKSKADDEDLCAFLSEFQITGAKLAGALNGLAYGRDLREGAFTVAYLKRALGHLHAAQAALERVAAKSLLPAEMLAENRTELFAIREEILRLMDEFRGRKS